MNAHVEKDEIEFGSFDSTDSKKNENDEPIDLILEFTDPYNFEEEVYTELDLSDLENWNAAKMCACEKAYRKSNPTSLIPLVENEFRLLVAQKASGKPIEFFKQMPVSLANSVGNMVLDFFGQ